MKYDPVKQSIGSVVGTSRFLRPLLYRALNILLLRSWHVRRVLRRLLAGRKRLRVWDAGCGFGQYSYFLARSFPSISIYATDIKTEQIEDCRSFFSKTGISNTQFETEDLLEPKHENEFDLILSVDVMEHIPDDVAVFRNYHRALKPGGLLIVNTPSDQGGSDAHSQDEESFIEEHARNGYGEEEIRAKLADAGLEVLSFAYSYGKWGMLSWRLAMKYPMTMLNVHKLFFVVLPLYYVVTFPFAILLMIADYLKRNESGAGIVLVAQKR